MSAKFSTLLRTRRAYQIQRLIDRGVNDTDPDPNANVGGWISLYDGQKPSNADSPVTNQTKLGTLNLTNPCGTVSNGILTFNRVIEDPYADETGMVQWARVYAVDGYPVMDLDAGIEGSGAQIVFDDIYIVKDGPILCRSARIVEGNR